MKIYWSIIFLFLLPLALVAQQKTEYNIKGDDAFARQDYRDARMWYEEGVAQCDRHSIIQLTKIWKQETNMRASMRSLMGKCLNCLNVMSNQQDTLAISYVIDYYHYGIGTDPNEQMENYWRNYLSKIRKFEENNIRKNVYKKKEPMHFFVGYAFSPEAPVGLTIGGVKKHLGWYVRFKTNFSFDNYNNECYGTGELLDNQNKEPIYQFTGDKKKNSYMGTTGLVIKCTSWLYTSVGIGYGSRELLYKYSVLDEVDSSIKTTEWAKHIDNSYKGVALEADVMLKFGPIFVSAGCSTLNFKYADLNAGVGVFF